MNSETLWRHGVSGAVRLVVETVEVLGGSVQRNRVSRCDPATDWLIPGGLSLEFLRELRVPRHTKTSQMMSGDRLETFHFGNKDSPIQLRIYDKANEVASKGDKLWFLNAWGLTATASKRRSWLDCRKKRIDILDRRKSCDGRSASWRPR